MFDTSKYRTESLTFKLTEHFKKWPIFSALPNHTFQLLFRLLTWKHSFRWRCWARSLNVGFISSIIANGMWLCSSWLYSSCFDTTFLYLHQLWQRENAKTYRMSCQGGSFSTYPLEAIRPLERVVSHMKRANSFLLFLIFVFRILLFSTSISLFTAVL